MDMLNMKMIPVAGPSITQKEINYVADAAANAWYENANMYHERFEKAFGEYIGTKYAIALPSCTSAIHLSLLSMGIGKRDEVIVPDLTWIATSAPISYVGAKPVFADCDRRTWCISADSFESLITPRTKAVIPVDLYGNMPEMDAIREIASDHNIAIVEDAAEAIGSEYHGKKSGSLGDTGVFSFHGSKTMTTGEGGMLVTDREDIYQKSLMLRDHGRAPGDKMFWNAEVGYKYKMSSMQAALGLAQLERINELVDKKRKIFGWYAKELKGVKNLALNYEPPDTKNSYWMVTIIPDPALHLMKEEIIKQLNSASIAVRPFFYPLSSLPAYQHIRGVQKARKNNKISYQISPYGINLPSGLNLDENMVKYVCDTVKNIINT